MDKFLFTLLGTKEYGEFAALFVLGIIGAICGLVIKYLRNADKAKANPETPKDYDFLWMLRDNFLRFMFSLFLILPAIRFSSQFFGTEATTYGAFFYGLSLDQLVALFSKIQDGARPNPAPPVEPLKKS